MKMGFSVNVPAAETQVVALKPNDLDGLFGGKDNYKIADDAEEPRREVIKDVRVGYELFPWLMFLILALVTAENLLANKFHRETPRRPPDRRYPEEAAAMSISLNPIGGSWILVVARLGRRAGPDDLGLSPAAPGDHRRLAMGGVRAPDRGRPPLPARGAPAFADDRREEEAAERRSSS